MILAIDTSSAACTAALFDGSGKCLARRDELIGRGHSEHLVPLIGQLLNGRTPSQIVVGVGPGSFTGIRIAIAAAHGLAIGWRCPIDGMSSLALLAAGQTEPVGVAIRGGHGELFVQQFDRLETPGPMVNLPAAEAAAKISADRVVGSGAVDLVAARGWGEALDLLPSAAHALRLPEALRTVAPKPLYARAPDARPRQAA